MWDNNPKLKPKQVEKPWVTDYEKWVPMDPVYPSIPGIPFPKKKPVDEAYDLAKALEAYQKAKQQAEEEAKQPKKKAVKKKPVPKAKKPRKVKPAKEPHIDPGDFDREI